MAVNSVIKSIHCFPDLGLQAFLVSQIPKIVWSLCEGGHDSPGLALELQSNPLLGMVSFAREIKTSPDLGLDRLRANRILS